MVSKSRSQVSRVIQQKVFNKDSKEFHESVFDKEAEMDKFFENNPNAQGFEIYDHFRKVTEK
jgi:hypothetical protein